MYFQSLFEIQVMIKPEKNNIKLHCCNISKIIRKLTTLLPLIINAVLLPYFFKEKKITFYFSYNVLQQSPRPLFAGTLFLQDYILKQNFIHHIFSIHIQILYQTRRVLPDLICISYQLLMEFFVFAFCQTVNVGNLDFRVAQ